MKHTFWYIDQLMILLKETVLEGDWKEHKGELRTESERKQARAMLNKIKQHDSNLRKLIYSHKTNKHLKTLHNCHIDSIPDWSERISEQFGKLDSLLKVLEEDIPKLERVLESEPHMWGSRIHDMGLGFVIAGFHDSEHNMEEFRKASVFEIKHLLEIITDIEYIDQLLK